MTHPRILVAGVGNIFLGDDAFGVEVAQRLVQRPQPEGVRIVDFGICGLDLTYALLEGYEAVVFVDALPRGGSPGTLYVLEPDVPQAPAASVEMHNVDPVKVLQLAAAMGGRVDRLLVVGCEPTPLDACAEMRMGLRAPVRAAVDQAVPLVEAVVGKLLRGENVAVEGNSNIPEKEVTPCRD
jgi:hydrogenase maturation protease